MPDRRHGTLIEIGEGWLERLRQAAAPFVVRLGQVERPDKVVVVCEVEAEQRGVLLEAVQAAWSAFEAE